MRQARLLPAMRDLEASSQAHWRRSMRLVRAMPRHKQRRQSMPPPTRRRAASGPMAILRVGWVHWRRRPSLLPTISRCCANAACWLWKWARSAMPKRCWRRPTPRALPTGGSSRRSTRPMQQAEITLSRSASLPRLWNWCRTPLNPFLCPRWPPRPGREALANCCAG